MNIKQGRFLRAICGLAFVMALWWFVPSPDSILFPPLGQVFSALGEVAASGTLWRDIGHSAFRVLGGVSVSVSIAILLGFVALANRRFVDVLIGIVEILRPIPPIAWTPVAILLFGIGSAPAIAIVAISSFFPMWLSLLNGIDSIDSRHVMAARSLGANRIVMFTDVLLPSILPNFLHGLRLAVGFGWFSVIAAEMVGASTGLGQAVQNNSLNLEMTKTYGYLLVIGLIGFLSSWLVLSSTSKLERNSNG